MATPAVGARPLQDTRTVLRALAVNTLRIAQEVQRQPVRTEYRAEACSALFLKARRTILVQRVFYAWQGRIRVLGAQQQLQILQRRLGELERRPQEVWARCRETRVDERARHKAQLVLYAHLLGWREAVLAVRAARYIQYRDQVELQRKELQFQRAAQRANHTSRRLRVVFRVWARATQWAVRQAFQTALEQAQAECASLADEREQLRSQAAEQRLVQQQELVDLRAAAERQLEEMVGHIYGLEQQLHEAKATIEAQQSEATAKLAAAALAPPPVRIDMAGLVSVPKARITPGVLPSRAFG